MSNSPTTCLNRFKNRLSSEEFIIIEDGQLWKGMRGKYKIQCSNNHIIWISPRLVYEGTNWCDQCRIDKLTNATWIKFNDIIANLGGIVIENSYLGYETPHKIKCQFGHDSTPTPHNILSGQGICLNCINRDSFQAINRFINRLEEIGAIWLEDEWKGARSPHKVECALGHINYVLPNNVLSGHGICRECQQMTADTLYITCNDKIVKFGISHNIKRRLHEHSISGIYKLIKVYENLPDELVFRTERVIIKTLVNAGYIPIYGREYFNIECLPIIIEITERMLEVKDSKNV